MVNNAYMVKKGHKEFSGNEIRNCIFLYFYLLTRDSPTPVWHLSSLTPEKSTLWTPSKYADVVIYQNLGKPKNRDDSGEILTATLFESFLSYQTHEGRLAL